MPRGKDFKMNYVDTSVIVSALDPLDPRQKYARAALEENKDNVISELAIAELASVLARRESLRELKAKIGLREELIIPAVILYLIRRFNLRYERANGHAKIPALGEMYLPITIAINLSRNLKLKTLDLLHIAYAKLLRDQGKRINVFLTIDKEFEKATKIVDEKFNIKIKILGGSLKVS